MNDLPTVSYPGPWRVEISPDGQRIEVLAPLGENDKPIPFLMRWCSHGVILMPEAADTEGGDDGN